MDWWVERPSKAANGLASLLSSCSLNYCFLIVPQGGWVSAGTPSVISLYCGPRFRGGVPVTVSSSLLPFSVWSLYPLLGKSCSISPQLFFRRNYLYVGVDLVWCGRRWVRGLATSPSQTCLWEHLCNGRNLLLFSFSSVKSLSDLRGF